MFHRIQPLKRFLTTSAFSAPKYRPFEHLTKHYHTRPTTRPFTAFGSCAHKGHRYEQHTAATYYKNSGAGVWTVAIVFGLAIGGTILIPLVKNTPEKTTERQTSSA